MSHEQNPRQGTGELTITSAPLPQSPPLAPPPPRETKGRRVGAPKAPGPPRSPSWKRGGQESASSNDYYQRLKQASPIGAVCRKLLAGRITRETGTELFVNCPHHESQSKTSLHVSLDLGLWNCFGCGQGGDVIQLVEFVQTGGTSKSTKGSVSPGHIAARNFLAAQAGMAPLSSGGGAKDAEEQAVFSAMTSACEIFHARLVAPESAEVLEWVMAKYGLTKETVVRFKIGWSGGLAVFDEVVALGHASKIVLATGLFNPSKQGNTVYSCFKKRVVFPYWSGGQVVYAIARKTEWTEENKYEVAKYKKVGLYDEKKRPYVSRCVVNPALFGVDILRERCEEVILTEGVVDAIAALQAGFPAVTPATIRLKRGEAHKVAKTLKQTRMVYIVQDNELSGAGFDGAMETAEVLEEQGVTCKVVEIPPSAACEKARKEFEELLGTELYERFIAAPMQEKKALLKAELVERSEDHTRATDLVLASKIDLCDYLRENPGPDSLKALLEKGIKPIELLIARAPKYDDDDKQRESVRPLLVRICKEKAPFKTQFLKLLKTHLDNGWTLADLKAIGKEAAREVSGRAIQSAKTSGATIECNDNFLGDEFVREHGCDVRFAGHGPGWAIWDSMRWCWDRARKVEGLARQTVEPIGRRAELGASHAAMSGDTGAAKILGAFAKRALSMQGVRAALDVAAGTGSVADGFRICLPFEDFDSFKKTRNLINCRSGVVDLEKTALIPHKDSKDLLITKLADVNYVPEAKCPIFVQALEQIFEADLNSDRAARIIDLLQVALGYSLLGEQTHHLVFMLYGPEGRNGKSLLISIIQDVLGGDYATMAAPGLLRQKRGDSHPTELADLHGRRFVSVVETGRNDKLDEALVKHLSGGDKVKARRMREDFWEFEPTHHLWIATNNLPHADAFDPALWARFRVIPFRRRFLKPGDDGFEESPAVCQADDKLLGLILAQEREGIFAWLVEGARKYLERGEVPNPPEARKAVDAYRDRNDPLCAWIEDACETRGNDAAEREGLSDEWWTPLRDLEASFSVWREKRGQKAMPQNAFSRALTGGGFPTKKRGREGQRGRLGIRLRQAVAPPPPASRPGGQA